MREWVRVARRRYGVEPSDVIRAYDDRTAAVQQPLAPGQSLPAVTRSGPFGLRTMQVRRTITEATFVVETTDGTSDVRTVDTPATAPESRDPAVVTVEERLAVATRLVTTVALAAIIAIGVGIAVVMTGTGGPQVSIGVLLLAAVVAAVGDGYTRLRDCDDQPLDSGVLHSTSEPFGHWFVAIMLGFVVIALAPGRTRLLGAGWLALLLCVPALSPGRRLGIAVSDWLHGWTVIAESRAVFPGPIGDPFSGGVKQRLARAEADTALRLLPTFVGQWTADGTHCQYRFSFESVDDGTRVVQRVALKRTARAMQVLVLPLLFAGLLWAGWYAVEAGITRDPASASLTTVLEIRGLTRGLFVALAGFAVYVGVVGPTIVRLSRRPNLVGEIRELSETYLNTETTFDALFAGPAGACLLLGMVTLTGQNVLFDLFDIPKREHRADLAAAATLGTPDPLLAVFDQLDDIETRTRRAGTGTLGALPVDAGIGPLPALLTRPFRTFFGAFALTAVHPSIDARRQRLRAEFETAV